MISPDSKDRPGDPTVSMIIFLRQLPAVLSTRHLNIKARYMHACWTGRLSSSIFEKGLSNYEADIPNVLEYNAPHAHPGKLGMSLACSEDKSIRFSGLVQRTWLRAMIGMMIKCSQL